MKRFEDFSKEEILDGDKIRLDDILNQEVAVLGCSVKSSKHKEGKYLTLQIELNGEKHVLFTGSKVLIDQAEKYKSEMPFMATIRKINKYYSFT
jgi:hypothetical protein